MSTLRISNIEAKADSSSPTVDEQLKFTNSDGDVLLHLDGRTAGITTVGINTTNSTIKFDANNNILITGIVTATEFHGTLAVGTSVTYGDNEKAYFGNGLDLSIYHNGTESIIHDNGSGNLKLRTDSFRLRNAADTEHIIKAIETGSVELYFNTIKKFETTNTGVSVSGEITCNVNSNIDMSQSADGQLQIGGSGYTGAIALNDDGMQIYHNSTSRAIIFGTNETERIRINSAGLVGIATNSPQATLHVRGSVKFTNAGLQTNFSSTDTEFDVRQTNSTGWSNMNYATHPLIKWNWVSGPGDHLYLASGGNTPVTTQMAMLISDSHGVKVGRSGWDGVNSTDLSTEYFRINTDGDVLINTSTTPTADIKLLVSGNGGVSSGSYFSFRGDYGNVPEPAAYAIKYDSSATHLSGAGGLHQYAYGGIAFNLGGQDRVNFTTTGKVSIGSTETSTGLLLLDKNITAESDVSDKNNYHLVIRSQSDSNTSKIGIAFANTSDDTHVGAAILHHRETTDSVGSLAFYTSPSSGITSERFRVTRYGELGLSGANYGTDGQVLTSGGAGAPVEWRTIVQAPVISSISGSIVANLSGTTLTLSGQHFGSGQGTVNFSGGSLNPSKNVNATPSSDTSITVTVPSTVANNVNSGETITIKFTNSAGLIGSGINTTVIAAPSGGSITTSGNYRIHTFTSSSNFVLTKSIACEYLVVAGGGAGGSNDGGQDFSGGSGGGGAGGYRTGTVTPSANTHTVTVGGGGAGNNSAAAGGDGGNSAFGSIVSTGGGGGGGVNNAGSNGRNGGSGGGAGGDDGSSTFTGGSATSGQGNAGGDAGGSNSNAGGGGGGGAGAAGETAANGFAGGDGGDGLASSITGSSVTRAGGGGGSVGAGTDKGLGGAGGGGNGAARSSSNSTAGSTNTGGGGGAGADSNATSEKAGANGGSGIVIVRYDITNL